MRSRVSEFLLSSLMSQELCHKFYKAAHAHNDYKVARRASLIRKSQLQNALSFDHDSRQRPEQITKGLRLLGRRPAKEAACLRVAPPAAEEPTAAALRLLGDA